MSSPAMRLGVLFASRQRNGGAPPPPEAVIETNRGVRHYVIGIWPGELGAIRGVRHSVIGIHPGNIAPVTLTQHIIVEN